MNEPSPSPGLPAGERLLVIDLEATCWEHGKTPPGQASEIIEIGACEVDIATPSVIAGSKTSIIVKPRRSSVSQYCETLTGLTQDIVDKGVSFDEACHVLASRFKPRAWCSWGEYDRKMMVRQCKAWKIPFPLPVFHVNLKERFATLGGSRKQVGMAKALARLGMPLEGRHHRGHDDAWNIARIATWMISTHGRDQVVVASPVNGNRDGTTSARDASQRFK